MSSSLAIGIWLVLLVALFRFDPAKRSFTSLTLWIPVIWFVIIGSRLPSQWLSAGAMSTTSMDQGNSLDRIVYLSLITSAVAVLATRPIAWSRIATSNLPLLALLAFALLSVVWSDFPFITFKRWVRDIGVYLAILIAVTAPRPDEAVSAVIRRVFYLLIPLSIVLIKYVPDMARQFDWWTGQGYSVGATTSKNMLGVLCLVGALFFLSSVLEHWSARRNPGVRRLIWVDSLFLGMTLWLLSKASSATSTVCLVLGVVILIATRTRIVRARPAILTSSIAIGLVSYLILDNVFRIDIMGLVSRAVGRSPDLTGRTHIWDVVLSVDLNPFLGVGYEAFWLGERKLWIWERAGPQTHAHNGYLETYLNVGLIGLGLLLIFLVASYVAIGRRFHQDPVRGAYGLVLWTILLFYNVTEAAFRGQTLWNVFVMFAILAAISPQASAEQSDALSSSSARGRRAKRPRYGDRRGTRVR